MQLSLGGPTPLSDGFGSFNESARDALNSWNTYLQHLTFAANMNSVVPPAENDDEMSVEFSNTVFGDSFGSGTLAITLLNYRGSVMEETDTLFNTHYVWDSYRGPLRGNIIDFHRVAIHEFGHTLGLDHPDDAHQHVSAIMNSRVSDIDSLQQDDINGAMSLYNTGPAYQNSGTGPVLLNLSTRGYVGTGENVLIGGFIIQGSQPATVVLRAIGYSLRAAGITAPLSDPTITVYNSQQQVVATNDDWFTASQASTIASYRLDPPNSIESALYMTLNPGNYTAVVAGYSDATTPPATGVGLVELYDLHKTPSRAGNISTRGLVQSGENVLIAGFIVGNSSKQVVVRALGPSLTTAGIAHPLADPNLELHDGNGTLLQSNDNWEQGPDAQAISDHGLAPTVPVEAALLATLTSGSYTAIVRGAGTSSGLALVEVYDLSPSP